MRLVPTSRKYAINFCSVEMALPFKNFNFLISSNFNFSLFSKIV